MINVVTFKWGAKYQAAHVNALRAQIDRHYSSAARLICVTNDAAGIDTRVDIVPDDEDFADIRSPHGLAAPSCYRRLRIWRPDAAQWFGERFVCIDLDVVAVADLAPLWDRPEPVVMYADPFYAARGQYCGSMILLSAGAAPEAWECFDPQQSPRVAREWGYRGSDQAWLSYALHKRPTWSPADGVYSYRIDCKGNRLPHDARLVIFHGKVKPWDCSADWIRPA